MRYRDLAIQTQREAPNNARTQGAAWLVRAGYLSREGEVLPLGSRYIERIRGLRLGDLHLPLLSDLLETFFITPSGSVELLYCPACGAVARRELSAFRKFALPPEPLLPTEKVGTPDCNTIESLAAFLHIPKEKTAKALMFTRLGDGKFVFVVVRGDMALSEAKLQREVGQVRLATAEEIVAAGAVPGYASPVGLKDALIVVDDLVPVSCNLAAGANEAGYHLINTNCGRDYLPEVVTDMAMAEPGFPCAVCASPLELKQAEVLAQGGEMDPKAVLLALAETYHDDKGLQLPSSAAPFDVYLMQVTGKELDTRSAAEKVYEELEAAGLSVLFDDREERAGVKFNDADLIGCPLRVTVGEKGLRERKVELKPRTSGDTTTIPLETVSDTIREILGGE